MFRKGVFVLLSFCVVACSEFSIEDWPAFVPDDQLVARPKVEYPWGIDVAAVRGDHLWVHHDGDFFHSSDAGRTWSTVTLPQRLTAVGLQVSNDSNTVVLISDSGKLLRSDNAGETWVVEDLKPALAQTESNVDFEGEYFALYEVFISDDFNKIAVVADCDILISGDGAKSWRSVASESSYVKRSRDYCVSDVILNEQFEPQYSLAYMTGSIASDEYVMQFSNGKWSEMCSFGVVGLLLKFVADCREIEQIGELNYFYQKDSTYPHSIDEDYQEAIFFNHHFPITDKTALEAAEIGLSDGAGSRSWIIDYRGISISLDEGDTWKTLLGGVNGIEERVALNDGTHIARDRDNLYFSDDGVVWQRDKIYEAVGDIMDVPGGALAIYKGELILIESRQRSSKKYTNSDLYQLLEGDNVIWAVGYESLIASVDNGDSWIEAGAVDINSDSIDWHCADVCIKLDYSGQVWVARVVADGLGISVLSTIDSSKELYMTSLWSSPDLKNIVAHGYVGESEESDYWLSSDSGNSWAPLVLENEDINDALFPSTDKIILSSTSSIHIIDAKNNETVSTRMPGYIYDDSLCLINEQLVAFSLEGDHPGVPGDDDYFTIYSKDFGASWFAAQPDFSWCGD